MLNYTPVIQPVKVPVAEEKGLTVDVLRLDLLHPEVSGNKWFKLKYNLEEAIRTGHKTVLTFGGAFSNHIHATASACALSGLQSIGVIRGEEVSMTNPTLREAAKMGMKIHTLSRSDYQKKNEEELLTVLKNKLGDFYVIPEGGNNSLGIKGCAEILGASIDHDQIFCAVGTGATYEGLSKSLKAGQALTGVCVLKGFPPQKNLLTDYHFGGYARHTGELLNFKKEFEDLTGIPLDYVYTAKSFFAVNDLVKKNHFKRGSRLLIIHSGGLQGNKGYEERYSLKPSR